jgi:hypothetical protein
MLTGLDRGARQALLRALANADVEPAKLVGAVLDRGAYGDTDDYLSAVGSRRR